MMFNASSRQSLTTCNAMHRACLHACSHSDTFNFLSGCQTLDDLEVSGILEQSHAFTYSVVSNFG
jgi:hypothetical protein